MIGLQLVLDFCSMIAPSPYDEASAEIFESAAGS